MEETHVMPGKGMTCKCPHHKAIPVAHHPHRLGFPFGSDGNVLSWNFVDVTWPILLMIGGIVKLVRCGCCSK